MQGDLTLDAPVACTPLRTDAAMAGPWSGADVALRVYLAPYPSSGAGGAPPSTPDACSAAADVCSLDSQTCAATTRTCVAAGGGETEPSCLVAANACNAALDACAGAAEVCEAARGGQRVVPVSAVRFLGNSALLFVR